MLAALFERERHGEGQAVELPMLEAMAQFVLGDHMGGRSFDPPLGDPGYARLLAPDRRPYKTKDGYVCTLVYTDRQWKSFGKAIGREQEFAADPRLQTQYSRSRHFAELYALVAEVLATRTTAEWLDLLQKHDIPVGPLNDLNALIDDSHLAEVGFFQQVEHPTEGTLRLTGVPSRWSRSTPGVGGPPPNLGEHSEEVLLAAGFSAAEVDDLFASGVSSPFRAHQRA
jgi:crotonobetainyl-CoA:carnitine CoA-transferase CaiB-like acyl-CoA transferase